MAVLTSGKRAELWKEFMSEISRDREVLGALTKQQLRAAVDAIDDWLHSNAAALNSAIPQPARGALTTAQKARLLVFVVKKRFLEGA